MRLTFKQVAEKAGVNISTAAFQRNKFEQFFTFTGSGRHRKYGEDSIELLKLISKMYAESKTYEDILDVLENSYGVQVTDIAVKDSTSTTQLDIVNAVKDAMREELERRDEVIESLENKVDEMARGSQERDKVLMETLREIKEKNEKKGWKFWK